MSRAEDTKLRQARGLLHTRGKRMTGQRVVILQIIQESNRHLDAEELYRLARTRNPRINLATVYRTLGAAARTATLKVPLTRAGRGRRRPLHTRVRVGFVPKQRGAGSSTAFVNVTFG